MTAPADSHDGEESRTKQRGLLIVVEGLDRSGKTTQCQRLCETIRGHEKQMIDSYLRGKADQNDQAIHLLFSANRWEAVQGILDDIRSGITVIVDRYSFSGAVYSAAKENPSLSLEWAWNPEIGLPQPDVVLFLDISSEDAARRGGYGEERYEKEEMQKKVRALFKGLFEKLKGVHVHVVDAGQSLEEVAEQIQQVYTQRLQRHDVGIGGLQTLPAL